ncbi:MAG: PAS domain S-box protein [Candidatus Lokiarchaeota archaeon]
MKLSALLGFTSLFFATITRPFLRIFGKLNDMKSVRISLYFSLIAVIFIIIHLILLIYNVFVKNFSFPSNLGNIFIFLLGFVALFLIIITYITRIFKTHLNFKMWTFFNSLNYIALVFIFVHGILFDIGLRSIGILIFFTILLIISIQTNVYGRFKTEKKIEDKNKLQNLISKFSSRFLFKANINKGINEFLHDLGIICGADRAYLFLFDKEYNFMKNTHEWTKENVAPQIHLLQNLPFENYQWWVEKIKKGEYIHIKDVSKLPSEASTERNLLEKQRIKSLLVFPIRIKDEVLGFLGLDNIQNTDAWDKEDFKLLRISSELIGNVLEYKSTLKELDMSEEKYKIITENANDIIIIINERYELEYLNEITNKRLLGTSGKNLYGTNILKYIHPDDRIKVLNALRKGLKEGEGIIESRIQHKLGYYAWFELKGKRIYDKREKEFKGIIVAREITERKNAEQQLKESENTILSVDYEVSGSGAYSNNYQFLKNFFLLF